MDNTPDLNTVALVAAAVSHDITTDGYLPPPVVDYVVAFATACDNAWEDIPQHIRDCNGMPWDLEILPELMANYWIIDKDDFEVDDSQWEIHLMKSTIIDIILSDWTTTDFIQFIKTHHGKVS